MGGVRKRKNTDDTKCKYLIGAFYFAFIMDIEIGGCVLHIGVDRLFCSLSLSFTPILAFYLVYLLNINQANGMSEHMALIRRLFSSICHPSFLIIFSSFI